ncbi:MAG: hypothetical protein ABL921_20715 [Pirellula sp.]
MAACNEARVDGPQRAITSEIIRKNSLLAVMLGIAIVTSSGCISFMANMVRVIKGTDAPAEFDEFQNKKVAVVAGTPSGLNADATGIIVSSHVHALLASHVKKIQMVSQEEVTRMIGDEPADKLELSMLGKRLGADFVVVVDVADLKLREGQTLFKGFSNSSVAVYKVNDGSGAVFRKNLTNFTFPNTGVPVTDVDEATFHRFYLKEVAQRLARSFYPYDPTIDVAKDASIVSLQSFQ